MPKFKLPAKSKEFQKNQEESLPEIDYMRDVRLPINEAIAQALKDKKGKCEIRLIGSVDEMNVVMKGNDDKDHSWMRVTIDSVEAYPAKATERKAEKKPAKTAVEY